MIRDILPPRLHEVLRAIYEYTKEYGNPPYRNNRWIAERTGYEGNHVTNIKGELRKLGFLTEELHLTPLGHEYVRIYFGAFTVKGAKIRIQGNVRASPGKDVIANYDDFDFPSDDTITLPDTTSDMDTFALRVDGLSMTELGILNGDYLIVERPNSLWWPNPQDVIVARYLPHDSNRSSQENVDPENYLGPVVKVYLQRFGENGCELGWQRDNEANPFIIKADHLIPIAKVKGVYRNINTILPLKR